MKHTLKQIQAYAKRKGYDAVISGDKVHAKNKNGAVWTSSMETMKKVCGDKAPNA